MSETGEALLSVREKKIYRDHILCFSGFTTAIGAHSIFEEVAVFSPLWFPKENSVCLLSLVFIAVHVILSVKDHKIIMLA